MKSAIKWHCILHSTFKDKDGKSKKINKGLLKKQYLVFFHLYETLALQAYSLPAELPGRPSYETPRVVKLIEKVEWWFPGVGKQEEWELLFNGN